MPLDPTSMTRFRKRLGEAGVNELLKLTIQAGLDTGTIQLESLKLVVADTTVMEKAVAYPNDLRLLLKARQYLVAQAKTHGIQLSQTYAKEFRVLADKGSGYAHARQMNRLRNVLRKMSHRIGRPEVACIRKGKARCHPAARFFNTTQGAGPHLPGAHRGALTTPIVCEFMPQIVLVLLVAYGLRTTISLVGDFMASETESDISDEERKQALWHAVAKLQENFAFSTEEMLAALGNIGRPTLLQGKKSMDVAMSGDVRDRLGMLLIIYAGLRTLFQDPKQAMTWIDRPNTQSPFEGAKPRELIVSFALKAL